MREAKKSNRLRRFKKYNYCILLPDDPIKIFWNFFTTIILFLVFIWTPWRIAFSNDDEIVFIVIDEVFDFIFLIDIIVTFFSATYNSKFILIDKWKQIAWKYLTSWFLIDVLSIIPLNLFFRNSAKSNDPQ